MERHARRHGALDQDGDTDDMRKGGRVFRTRGKYLLYRGGGRAVVEHSNDQLRECYNYITHYTALLLIIMFTYILCVKYFNRLRGRVLGEANSPVIFTGIIQ